MSRAPQHKLPPPFPTRIAPACLVICLLMCSLAAAKSLDWQQLPPLPDREGFAGPFAGVHNGALIIAGGANFPDLKPWEGGTKIWYDTAFVLEPGAKSWTTGQKLPRPLGYGVSLTTPRGIACLGGSDSKQHHAECFLLRWEDNQLKSTPLPDLPRPCANFSGALIGNTIYVAGGIETPDANSALHTFWSLDFDAANPQWRELDPWPGPPRMFATAGAQGGSFYLLGGASLAPGPDGKPVRAPLRDAYRYSPGRGWKQLADMPRPATAAPTPAPALGQSHLLIVGGDDATQVDTPPTEHPGFPREALAYHTITDTWVPLADLPFSLVTTPTTIWNNRIIIPGGEQRPGVRSPQVWSGAPRSEKAAFGWANYATLSSYFFGMLAIGWICARRNKNTADYFKASGRIPWWAAGLSIYATMLSSLTFMGVPAKAYSSDWAYFLNYFSILLLAPIIIHFYLPFFRQLNVTSAYEYLERRFNLFIRLFGSASFITFQIGRTGIVLYLPALALSTVSSLDMSWCIVGMALLAIALTVYGGMEAVIWTDVAQTIILLGAVIVSLLVIAFRVDGGFESIWNTAHAESKFFEDVRWTTDLTFATGWVALIGMGFTNLISYTANQEVVQRYLTTKDLRQSARAVWTNALFSLPSGILFFCVGTGLFVFYHQFPERVDPTLPTDAILPLFILHELPTGVAGFVVAGIFAAAQPTSGLNSTAAAVVTDFYRRLRGDVTDHQALVAGRIATTITGLLGMTVALLAMRLNIQSIWEIFLNVLGLTTGALAGLFTLGIFTRRANATGAMLGLVAGVVALYLVSMHTQVHPLLYGAVGVIGTFVFGYLLSLPFPKCDVEGLTIHSLRAASRECGAVAAATTA